MKKIVILGAGYGGILTALGLSKKYANDFTITLIDRHDYQLFASNLYEVATADEELVSQRQLKKSIAIPLSEILSGHKVTFVQAEIGEINREQKTVAAGDRKISYDYLIVAMGSISDYFGVAGAKDFSLPLKTLTDGLRIRNAIEFAIQTHRMDISKPNVRVVIAGGGYTGVEFAAELAKEMKFVAFKNQYPPEKIEIDIVEAMPQIIAGFSQRLSQDALNRLKKLGVRVQLSSPIAGVDQHFLSLSTGEKLEYDVLVWAAGVRAVTLPFTQPLELDKKGRIVTNGFLQASLGNLLSSAKPEDSIFALGDCACVINADTRPAPPTAQDAVEQAKYLVYTLPLIAKNQKPLPYKGKKHGFIVALGGQWAIMDYGGFYFRGWVAYVVDQFAHINYYRKVVGWVRAFKYIAFQVDIYRRNDGD